MQRKKNKKKHIEEHINISESRNEESFVSQVLERECHGT